MNTEPKTIRESNILIAGIDTRLGLVQKMVWAIIALLGTLLANAVALYVQIGDLRTDLAVVKTNVAAINDRVGKIEESIDDIRADETRIKESLSRIEMRLAVKTFQGDPVAANVFRPRAEETTGGVQSFLSDQEEQLVRDALKDRVLAYKKGLGKPSLVEPLPESVVSRIPRLRGLRYSITTEGNKYSGADRHSCA